MHSGSTASEPKLQNFSCANKDMTLGVTEIKQLSSDGSLTEQYGAKKSTNSGNFGNPKRGTIHGDKIFR
jgi:hypothetical protein